LPDSCILTHFMLVEITDLVKNLLVHTHNMERNLYCYGGVVFSQQVLLTLVAKGLSREDSYEIVQQAAHLAWNKSEGDFRKLISENETVREKLTQEELAACFDPNKHLRNLDQIYQRLGI